MRKTVVIAGGGTGGHVYPGVAVGRAIQQLSPEIEVHFVGTKHGLEGDIVPREGFPLHTVTIGRLHSSVGLLRRLGTVVLIPLALFQSLWLCLKLRPRAVLGVGGFASGPFVLVASLLRFRTAIWEPNAYPGLANRWLSSFVGTAFVVFEKAASMLKTRRKIQAGMPVRFELNKSVEVEKTGFNILVFGGSQGARSINETLSKAVVEGGDWLENINIIHQAGRSDIHRMNEFYAKNLSQSQKQRIEVTEFLHDMKERYKWADLVICRSGASTVAELAACGKPAILIPYPYASDDHQKKNAMELVDAGAGEIVETAQLSPALLIEKIQELRGDPQRLSKMANNVRQFHRAKADFVIAKDLIGA